MSDFQLDLPVHSSIFAVAANDKFADAVRGDCIITRLSLVEALEIVPALETETQNGNNIANKTDGPTPGWSKNHRPKGAIFRYANRDDDFEKATKS